MLELKVEIAGKPVAIQLTSAAELQLTKLDQPLLVEMELYFSCLIRKQVRFYEGRHVDSEVPATDKLAVSFRPVMTKACGKDYEGDEPPLTDFPIAKPAAYIPHWLKLDYKSGAWHGEFGY